MEWWMLVINYITWYIFIFIAVTWFLLLLKHPGFYKDESEGMPEKKLPPVSILVPAYNEEGTIRMTLDSLLELDYPKSKLEIIVINDASTDSTEKIIKDEYVPKGVRLITNRKNSGKAFSLNAGIRAARHEIIGCVDADSIVSRDALKKMVEDFEDPQVGAVTPALKAYKPKGFLQTIQNAEYLLNIFLRKTQGLLDAIHVTPGVFSLYRKSVLEEVGGFDVGNIAEDMEIALNIHHKGYKITNRMDAITYTVCPSNFRELYKQRLRWYRGALHNLKKYKEMIFNAKYGNIGFFLLPINIAAIVSVIVAFGLLIYNFINDLMGYYKYYSLINWDFSIVISKFWEYRPETFFNNFFSTALVLGTISITAGFYLLYKSFKINGEPIKGNRTGFMLYLFIYPFFMMLFWFAAFFHEIFRSERKW